MKLLQEIEQLQSDADKMAYRLIRASKLAVIQSMCNFNIFWLDELSPVVLRPKTIDFLFDNLSKFKRKLEIEEVLNIDFIVFNFQVDNFTDFAGIFKKYNSKIMNNLKQKIM